MVLFEDVEGRAEHKARQVIRRIMGPDADADKLEKKLRTRFFRNGRTSFKFEPGAARIVYGELHDNWQEYDDLDEALKNISSEFLDKFDANLNGMSMAEIRKYADINSPNSVPLDEIEYTQTDYEIYRINSFGESTDWYEYTWLDDYDDSDWCICRDEEAWDSYTDGGFNTVYFCTKPGFDAMKAPERPGPDAPTDEYGLSMICIIVTPSGRLSTCSTRWNHAAGGTDHAMNAAEVSRVLGGNVFKLCPPKSKASRMESASKPRTYLYHRSNPLFRDRIKSEGLKPQVGETYEMYWDEHFHGQEKKPLIFLFDASSLYDSTYDDDLVRVDMSALDQSRLKHDPAFDGEWCYTYDLPIPVDAIEFIYEGTGDADGDGAGDAWKTAHL